jgi:hypothetical protein
MATDADRERLLAAGFAVTPSLTMSNAILWSRPDRQEVLSTEQALRLLDERSKAKGKT